MMNLYLISYHRISLRSYYAFYAISIAKAIEFSKHQTRTLIKIEFPLRGNQTRITQRAREPVSPRIQPFSANHV